MDRIGSLFNRSAAGQFADGSNTDDSNSGGDFASDTPLDSAREVDALYAYLFEKARQTDYTENSESDRIVLADGTELLGRIQDSSTDEELVVWMGVCLTTDKSQCQRRVPRAEVAEVERGTGVSPEERARLREKAERLVESGVAGLPELLEQPAWRMLAFDEPLSGVVGRLWEHGVACAYDESLTEARVTVDHWDGTGFELFAAIAESAGCRYVISKATVDFVRP